MRLNFLTVLFWNLIFGLFLAWLFLCFREKWQRLLTVILILGVVFQGLSYVILFSTFLDRKGEPIAKPDLAEREVFDWIKKNTTIKDYFLTFKEKSSDTYHNARFVIYTGRFAPDFLHSAIVQGRLRMGNLRAIAPEKALYSMVLNECDPAALDTLKYRYLYVNLNWPEGLVEKCLANNDLELVFQSGDHKIYKNPWPR